MAKSRYRLATVRRWSCSDTIDIDSEANPERAKRGAGTIGQAVKTLLAAYQSFSELVRVEKAAVSNSNLDLRFIAELTS